MQAKKLFVVALTAVALSCVSALASSIVVPTPHVGTAGAKDQGNSISDPGTGQLEFAQKPQATITGSSKGWSSADCGKYQLRSNSGSAMSDTLPASGCSMLTIENIDSAGIATYSVAGGSGTIGGLSSLPISAGRRITFVSDGAGNYRAFINNNLEVRGPSSANVGHVPTYSTSDGKNLQDGGALPVVPPQGRLTLTSGVAVLSSDVVAATSVCYTPDQGNLVPLYNGASMVATAFSEVCQTLSDATKSPAAGAASSCYDYFVWSDSGTFRVSRGPAWSSVTSRGTGSGTSELERVSGLPANKWSIANGPSSDRGTWVGVGCTDSGGATITMNFNPSPAAGGSANMLGLCNGYNARLAASINADSNDSWSYTTAAYQAKDASAANGITYVACEQGTEVDAFDTEGALNTSSAFRKIGVGYDSTSAPDAASSVALVSPSANSITAMIAILSKMSGLGRHTVTPLEYMQAVGAGTWYGKDGTSSAAHLNVMIVKLRI
ncbi:MAG TPA: hypothetical protein VGG48_14300 [Rhizomicrobium sp.]|jgi:hypothetical protein